MDRISFLVKTPLRKALIGYLAIRSFVFTVFFFSAYVAHKSPHAILLRWDAAWFRRIALEGYGHVIINSTNRHQWDYAFFPLFPSLERWIHRLTNISINTSGLIINLIASLVAAAGIYTIAQRLYSPRVAIFAVIAWALMPAGYVQWLAYSESIFTAFAAWSIVALLRKHWLRAGLLACLAGTTRALGIALVVAIAIAALHEYAKTRDFKDWRPFLGALISPIGLLSFMWWVGRKTHRFFGYFWVQKNWGMSLDFGVEFSRWIRNNLFGAKFYMGWGTILLLIIVSYIFYRNFKDKQPVPLLVMTTITLFFTFTPQGFFECKPRYLMPDFALLFPIALWLGKRKRSHAIVVLSVYTLATAAFTAFILLGKGPP
jgi:Gpi18-like mannosyltransferase